MYYYNARNPVIVHGDCKIFFVCTGDGLRRTAAPLSHGSSRGGRFDNVDKNTYLCIYMYIAVGGDAW